MPKFLKRLFCKHTRISLNRWHRCHGPNGMDPPMIEAEYICKNCGKVIYIDDPINLLGAYESTCKEYERKIQ